jgi:hypothetical protein
MMTRPARDLAHLNTDSDEIVQTIAQPQRQGGPRLLHDQPNRPACRSSVYPMPGRFLNPVALSNIETYPADLWSVRSGTPPRLLLRSSSGTLVTMQPSMKSAQSMLACSQPDGTQARAAR